ncbi:serine hydrolase [Lactobacillus sp. CBA3605]|uniref:serine hydrolase domain-containing protein n=1 Tax=Lactobacillus sp. CBA3605 TaxID=2099788 RepID=UPI000CFB31CB|nr:serine hydrolase domain-containing protein [Lactobacillus sp. CBA3605]AVK60825.1 serine hydrolase [Lactobacillus sp. CBA3605]
MMFTQTKLEIDRLVNQHLVPGVSYALLQGSQVDTGQVGVAQIQPAVKPLWSDALYDLASLTKVIGTTTLALQLRAQDALDFNRPIHDYLPAFKNQQVTIRHLMTHTSGISGYIPQRNTLSATELLAAIQQLPISQANLNHRVVYTDLVPLLTGLIIEKILGQAIQPAIMTHVIQPLGLPHATFTPQPANCIPTVYSAKTGLLQGVAHDPKARILGAHCGSAGLFASVTDLVRFARFMLGQWQLPAVLTPAVITSLYQDWTPNQRLRRSFGWNLWQAGPHRAPIIFHTGYTGTLLMLDQTTQSALIFLANRVHPTAPNNAFLPARRRLIGTWVAETLEN